MSLKDQKKLLERGRTLLNRGLTIPQIAKELHIPRQRAYDLFYHSDELATRKLEEAKREKEKFIRHRDKKIWELRAKGMIKREIADQLGISHGLVRVILDSDKVRADKLTTAIIEKEKQGRRKNKERAQILRKKGRTYKEIGAELGKSDSWVMITLGISQQYQKWPLKKRRSTAREYKRLLSEGHTTQEASDIVGADRSHTHKLRAELEEEERRTFKGTMRQYEKMRQKERLQFQEARKKKVRALKKAEEEEKKKVRGTLPLALGYARVSTDEQARKGVSLEYQVEMIEEYAEKHGYKLMGVLEEPGMHGDDYNRAQLQELIRRAEADEFDCIVVWMLDRLMRESYQQQKIMFEIFDPCNVDVKSTTQEWDRTTSHGKLIFTILGATNQYELDLIKDRARAASKHIWSKGEWKAPSAVPLGLRMKKAGKYLEEDPENMKRLKKIYNLINDNKGRLPSHPSFMNYEQIARECGVGKGKVFSLARTTLKEYLARYAGFMGDGE